MILLALFILTSILVGYALTAKLRIFESVFERSAAAVITGLSISTLVCFAISFALNSLSDSSILLTIIANISAVIVLVRYFEVRLDEQVPFLRGKIGLPEYSVAGVFLLLAYFNFLSLYTDGNGNVWGISNTWADYAFHAGIINSFALRDNFPPIYPNLEGAQMRYPFIVDFLSAIFVKGGVSLINSMVIPNLLLLFCLVVLVFAFLKRFTNSRELAALAMLLFFLNGNLGFVQFFNDYGSAPDKAAFLAKLPKAYSYLSAPADNLQFMNLSYSIFIPQRAALMGFPVVMLVLILLLRIQRNEAWRWEYFLAGVLAGLLPLIHASSFAIAAIACCWIFLITIVKKRRIDNKWLLFALPFILLAVPQLIFINEQGRTPDFLGLQVGWMSKAGDYGDFIRFWINNVGVILILGMLGLVLLRREQIAFMLPFLALFAAANLIRFQPWEWDNMKVFLYWFLFNCIAAAYFVKAIYEGASAFPNESKYQSQYGRNASRFFGAAVVFLVLFFCTFSGLLTFAYWNTSGAMLWSVEDQKVAKFISENTMKDAVFLTAGKHNHIAYTLAGRQILAGYDGHLWSHGLDYSEQASDARQIYATADSNLIEKWGIDYVYIGPQEVNEEWHANVNAFANSANFEGIYENRVNSVAIFKYVGK